MEGIEIGKLLAEFVLAAVILWLSDRQIKLMQEQIKARDERVTRLEKQLETCNEEHRKDLRAWAGIEAWQRRGEDDTHRLISAERQKQLRTEWEKRQGNSVDTD